MSRQLQAYFRTENDAEDARIRLQTYNVEQLEVGETGGIGADVPLLVPFAAAAPTTSTGTGNGTFATGYGNQGAIGSAIAFNEIERSKNDADDADDSEVLLGRDTDGDLRYVLSARVQEADYDDIVHTIRSNNGHVARFD